MKYIYSNNIKISNLKIIETQKIFKIIYELSKSIHIFGIIIKLDDITLFKKHNLYEIKLNSDSLLSVYDKFLSSRIKNYNNIIKEKIITVKPNSVIEDYYNKNKTSLYINIKYVKKFENNNIPIINII